jgi:AraC-like DNA-binding protein
VGIPALLRSLGADPEVVLGEVGCDPKLFDDPENRTSLGEQNRILNHCAIRTACPHFGLLVGQQDTLQSLGLIGLLVKYSPDVGTALRNLIRYQHLHVRGAAVHLAVDGPSAVLSWNMYEPGLVGKEQLSDGAIAVLQNFMRELCGTGWRPTEVWFAHGAPADTAPFRECFRVPLRFDAEQYALAFRAEFLTRPLPAVEADLRRLLQQQVDLLEARHPNDLAEQVRSVLRVSLGSHDCSAHQIATHFGMHRRTFARRLAEQGVQFQQLVDETRFELAKQLLEDTDIEVGEIADLLGYAAPAVFSRAFQRWSGLPPSQWRTIRRPAAAGTVE